MTGHGTLVRAAIASVVVAAAVLVGVAPAQAVAVPASPAFGPYAEPLARYEAPTICAPSAQAGTLALRSLLAATYPTRSTISTYRTCTGTTSSDDHQEGRALDWMMSASNPSDLALAQTFFTWLFATDAYGNTYANARRLGIEYMIWNHQMWRAYNPSAGWQPYTGSVPHTDHIHITLSWAGARKQTSWWNTAISRTTPCDPATMHCNADGSVDVLVTPGYHVVAGRQWSTTCQAYGSTGTRCFASIKASTARYVSGRWVTSYGWVLNRITYTDAASSAWDANVLARPGYHLSGGRKWYVSCSPWASTGPRTCTDSIWASVVAARLTSSGYTYGYVQKWVQTSVVRLRPAG